VQELLNNDHLAIKILKNKNKKNVEKLKHIIKIMFIIEQF
jgi:hypothetical protein